MILTLGSLSFSYAEDDSLYLQVQADYDKAYDVLDRINSERSKRGIGTLSMDQTLMDAAYTRAVETVIYFEHARPNGGVWHSVDGKVDGENLGKGTGNSAKIMKLWMESPGHRENIVRSEFDSIGVSCIEYEGTHYWVQLFSRSGSDGAERQSNGEVSLPLDLPPTEDGGAFAFDYSITMDGISEEEAEAKDGREYQLGLCANELSFDPAHIKWSISDPEIASVDDKGVLKITDKGRTEIDAASGSIERASIEIDSREDVNDLYVMDRFSHRQEISCGNAEDEEPPVPEVIILSDEGPLVKGRDYNLTCKESIAEIHGIGRYKGVVHKEFENSNSAEL